MCVKACLWYFFLLPGVYIIIYFHYMFYIIFWKTIWRIWRKLKARKAITHISVKKIIHQLGFLTDEKYCIRPYSSALSLSVSKQICTVHMITKLLKEVLDAIYLVKFLFSLLFAVNVFFKQFYYTAGMLTYMQTVIQTFYITYGRPIDSDFHCTM